MSAGDNKNISHKMNEVTKLTTGARLEDAARNTAMDIYHRPASIREFLGGSPNAKDLKKKSDTLKELNGFLSEVNNLDKIIMEREVYEENKDLHKDIMTLNIETKHTRATIQKAAAEKELAEILHEKVEFIPEVKVEKAKDKAWLDRVSAPLLEEKGIIDKKLGELAIQLTKAQRAYEDYETEPPEGILHPREIGMKIVNLEQESEEIALRLRKYKKVHYDWVEENEG